MGKAARSIVSGLPLRSEEMQFGNWFFNKSTGTLDYTGGVQYHIRLWEMKNSAEILDWILQIEEKSWASAEDIGNLEGHCRAVRARRLRERH
jgi:hypothetical protein